MEYNQIVLFKGKNIRRQLYNKEWYFSVVDIIKALTDSDNPNDYWYRMKVRLNDEEKVQLSTICRLLKLEAADRKKYETDCANPEGILRIIQSIPSPKAEPLKRWLAKIGYERIQEIENPELATKRTRLLYKLKGYPDDWIEKRMRGIGITPDDYKKLKGLEKENLRDHMDDFELIFTMLGEKSTTEIHKTENSKGVPKLKEDAKFGGEIAGGARKKLEKKLKKSIVSEKNFKDLNEKRLKK